MEWRRFVTYLWNDPRNYGLSRIIVGISFTSELLYVLCTVLRNINVLCHVAADQSYFQLTVMRLLKRTLCLRHLLLICCHRHSVAALNSCQRQAPLDCSQDTHNMLPAVPGQCSYIYMWPSFTVDTVHSKIETSAVIWIIA